MQDLGTAQGPSDSLRERHRAVGLARRRRRRSRPRGLRRERSEHRVCRRVPRHHHAIRPSHRRVPQRQRLAGEPLGHGGEDMKYRFQWTAPIAASPHDPKVIYHGAQVIFRTPNGGQSWDVDQPRSDAQRQVQAEVGRRSDYGRQHRRRNLRHRVRHCGVADAEGTDLGRQRRRARARDPRRRAELDERDRGRCRACPNGAPSA